MKGFALISKHQPWQYHRQKDKQEEIQNSLREYINMLIKFRKDIKSMNNLSFSFSDIMREIDSILRAISLR